MHYTKRHTKTKRHSKTKRHTKTKRRRVLRGGWVTDNVYNCAFIYDKGTINNDESSRILGDGPYNAFKCMDIYLKNKYPNTYNEFSYYFKNDAKLNKDGNKRSEQQQIYKEAIELMQIDIKKKAGIISKEYAKIKEEEKLLKTEKKKDKKQILQYKINNDRDAREKDSLTQGNGSLKVPFTEYTDPFYKFDINAFITGKIAEKIWINETDDEGVLALKEYIQKNINPEIYMFYDYLNYTKNKITGVKNFTVDDIYDYLRSEIMMETVEKMFKNHKNNAWFEKCITDETIRKKAYLRFYHLDNDKNRPPASIDDFIKRLLEHLKCSNN